MGSEFWPGLVAPTAEGREKGRKSVHNCLGGRMNWRDLENEHLRHSASLRKDAPGVVIAQQSKSSIRSQARVRRG